MRSSIFAIACSPWSELDLAVSALALKIVSRDNGQWVVTAAAYRSAEHLFDERIGHSFD
jgi:hypothetical protein